MFLQMNSPLIQIQTNIYLDCGSQDKCKEDFGAYSTIVLYKDIPYIKIIKGNKIKFLISQ